MDKEKEVDLELSFESYQQLEEFINTLDDDEVEKMFTTRKE